ncbi:OmpA family protein [Sphingomonas lutea]|uniref:OmpA family protein n=1 Tax=Sphingomonas lutea TaxID=1045317 RepID=A0A7G9SJD2_9SPHN|nr:OmpA family protein [Sphingomonas lutea]QNN67957.1 OmpA family protein [Sphingomonas lutea]
MIRTFLLATAVALPMVATSALAQPRIVQRVLGRPVPPPALVGIDALRADFLARAGADTIYFSGDTAVLSAPARATLAAQAQWLRMNPTVSVRIEGHADLSDTRDHAIAVGARRAEEVRQYLILMGVPAFQVGAASLGKERPGPGRTVTVLVR